MNAPAIQFTRTDDGVGIAYSVHGDGPPLLYSRGWSHLEYEWEIDESRAWLQRLGRSFSVVRFDPRGSGMSERTGSIEESAGLDAAAVLNAVGFGQVSLLGAGAGFLALETLVAMSDRLTAAILWSPSPPQGGNMVPEVYRRLLTIREVDPDLFLETLHLWQGWERPEARAARVQMRARSGLDEYLRHLVEIADERGERNIEAASAVDVPVLIVGREEVRFSTAAGLDELARRMRHAQRRTLRGHGLFPELGDIEEAARVVEDFLLPRSGPPAPRAEREQGTEPRAERSEVDDRTPSIRYIASSDGVRVPYWTLGSGPAVVILNLHSCSHLELEWEIDEVRGAYQDLARQFTVVRLDPRNSGLATRAVERYDLDALADDVVAVLAELPTPAHIAGMYSAGKVAVRVASRRPDLVNRLVLFEAPLGSVYGGDHYRGLELLAPLAAENFEMYSELTSVIFHGLHDPERTRREAAFVLEAITRDDFVRGFGWLTTSVRDELAGLQCPVLIVHDSRIVGTDNILQAVDLIPDAEVATLQGALNPRYLAPDAVPPVAEFLSRGETRAAPRRRGAFATILFTDVVASTPLLTQLRDERMRAVMRDHDAVCEAAIAEHGGRVVKTIGDAFMAEFAVPSAAIDAAIAIQRGIRERFAASDVPVRLRIGINAGEPIFEDDDLHGASVVIAKRLESAAESGGILVSDVVRQAVAGKEFAFEDRGPVPLGGFDEPVRAWAVRWEA